MTLRALFLLPALALLAACASTLPGSTTASVPGAVAPRGGGLPGGPIDLGDWRRADQQGQQQRFSALIVRRYAAGAPLSTALSDLRSNQFACAAPARGRAGDPPAQVCRRTLSDAGCTHTWQAHLWADAGGAKLARVRGLYDKRCAKDGGLLGGPGR